MVVFDWLASPELWAAFFTLLALEVVLNIDNVIFLSIITAKLPKAQLPRPVLASKTGLAQVNSFDGMPTEEKVAWDARYSRRLTLCADLAILFRTVGYLMKPPPTY